MQDILLEEIRKAERLSSTAPFTQECFFMSPLLLLALCFSEGLLNVKWSWIFPVFDNWIPGENYFVRFGCSNDLVLAGSRFLRRFRYFHRNWPLLTSRNFPRATFQRGSHASKAYFGKIKRGAGGWTGHLKSQMQTKNGWKTKDG